MDAIRIETDGSITVRLTPDEVRKIVADIDRAADVSDATVTLWRYLRHA